MLPSIDDIAFVFKARCSARHKHNKYNFTTFKHYNIWKNQSVGIKYVYNDSFNIIELVYCIYNNYNYYIYNNEYPIITNVVMFECCIFPLPQ